jgi:hypothetical protein
MISPENLYFPEIGSKYSLSTPPAENANLSLLRVASLEPSDFFTFSPDALLMVTPKYALSSFTTVFNC